MIKLFWNTHNQKKPSSSDKKFFEKQELNLSWGIYHKNNSDKWIYEIIKKIQYSVIENETSLEKEIYIFFLRHMIFQDFKKIKYINALLI